MQTTNSPDDIGDLRSRAELLAGLEADHSMEPEQVKQILHELRVHQIELEMQNEELRRTQMDLEASRARYFDLYDLAPVGYCTIDDSNQIVEANLTIAGMLGNTRNSLARQPFTRFIFPEDQDIYYLMRKQPFKNGVSQGCEVRLQKKDALPFWVRLEVSLYRETDGKPAYRAVITDISERKQLEATRTFLIECGYPGSKEDFFASLAHFLANKLDLEYVCIDRLSGDTLSAQTVAVCHDGQIEPNSTYTLKDTPCGAAVGKEICCFPSGVRALFPGDAVLGELKAESYIGTTLWSYDKKPIGLIAAIGRKPLTDTRQAELLLRLVAFRTAGELERKLIEDKINDIALFPEQNPSPVLRISSGGILLYGNPASMEFQNQWGFRVESPVPQAWCDLVNKCIAGRITLTKEVLVGKRTFAFTIIPLDHLQYVNVYAFDVTKRKQAVEILKKASIELETQVYERTEELQISLEMLVKERHRFNEVLDMLPAYVVLITPDHHIVFANRFFVARFGKSHEKRCFEWLHGRTVPCDVCESFKPFSSRVPHRWEWIAPDRRSYDVYDFLFTDVDGSPLILEMGIDSTDRKQTETALIEANEMKLLGMLTSGVAHEVRNPLNGIIAVMGALSREFSDDNRFQPFMHHMRDQVNRLTELMTDLLTLGKPRREEKLYRINLVQIFERTLLVQNQAFQSTKHSIRFITPKNPESFIIEAEETSIAQVIINLIENACDNSPPGTEIVCSVCTRPGNKVGILVRDEGTGIPAWILPRLFEPFFTTRTDGTGLGLSIVRRIVSIHLGTIVAYNNTDGPGATFEVELPLCVG